jgi:hypothetical protein
LQRLLVRIHGIGNVDGEHQLNIDRDSTRGLVSKNKRRERGATALQAERRQIQQRE